MNQVLAIFLIITMLSLSSNPLTYAMEPAGQSQETFDFFSIQNALQDTTLSFDLDSEEMVSLDLEFEIRYLAQTGDCKALKLVLAHNHQVDINRVYTTFGRFTKSSGTLLHLAAKNGHIDVVDLLLSYKANLDATNHQGATPLHLACFAGHADIALLLCRYGANPHATKTKGSTACLLARTKGLNELADCLEHIADQPYKFFHASKIDATQNLAKKKRNPEDDYSEIKTKKNRYNPLPLVRRHNKRIKQEDCIDELNRTQSATKKICRATRATIESSDNHKRARQNDDLVIFAEQPPTKIQKQS